MKPISSLRSRRTSWTGVVFVASAAVAAVWALVYLWWPLSRDQYIILWVADVVRHGGMPYRDALDFKGPLAFYLVALGDAMFGTTSWGYRLLDLFLLALSAAALAAIGRRWMSRAGRWTAVLLFVLWYASQDMDVTGQPDGWAGGMIALAAAALLTAPREAMKSRAAASAALVGMAMLIKPTYGIFLLLPVIYVFPAGEWRARKVIGDFGALALAAMLPAAITVAWFAARGALGALVDIYLRFNATVYAGSPLHALPSYLMRALDGRLFFLIVVAVPFAAMGIVSVAGRSRRDAAILALWLVGTVMNVVVQGKYWTYTWVPVLAPLALTAALGTDSLVAWARDGMEDGTFPGHLATAAQWTLLGMAVLTPLLEEARFAKYAAGLDSRAYYLSHFTADGKRPRETADVAAFLRERTRPGDPIQLYGMDMSIYVLSHRNPHTRFGNVGPLVMGGEHGPRARYQAEFLDDLRRHPPAYMIQSDSTHCARSETDTKYCFRAIPSLARFVQTSYAFDSTIGSFRVYHYTGAPQATR